MFFLFSIPTCVLLILFAITKTILFPPEPRFKSLRDCSIYADKETTKLCDNLRKDADTKYFDYERCYRDNYSIYYNTAVDEYHNPPEINGDLFDKIFHSYFGLPLMLFLGIVPQLALYRFCTGDKRWYWFFPDENWSPPIDFSSP